MRMLLLALPLLPVLLAAPADARADDKHCTHAADRRLQLDLDGVRTVRVETAQHTVRLRAASGASHVLSGRACASKAGWLDDLTLTQEKRGDTLYVRLAREQKGGFGTLFGDNYAWLDIAGTVPDDRAVALVVGSGDGFLEGGASASADVGSGDARLSGVRGAVTAKVGSGDIHVDGAGSLKVLAVGSGDVDARNVGGAVEVGSIGSGDLELDGARGGVRIGSIGSGDATLKNIAGAVRVDSIGSGDLDLRGAASLSVGTLGSGDVRHRDVSGKVDLPRKD